jgi:hypothetical protein
VEEKKHPRLGDFDDEEETTLLRFPRFEVR